MQLVGEAEETFLYEAKRIIEDAKAVGIPSLRPDQIHVFLSCPRDRHRITLSPTTDSYRVQVEDPYKLIELRPSEAIANIKARNVYNCNPCAGCPEPQGSY